jgi:hypothetical protein
MVSATGCIVRAAGSEYAMEKRQDHGHFTPAEAHDLQIEGVEKLCLRYRPGRDSPRCWRRYALSPSSERKGPL